MRKIIVGAQVSIDGVMQAPGGATEDPTRGFTFGGWAMPYFDPTFGEEVDYLFADGSVPHAFKLVRSRVSPNGLMVGHYEREGPVKLGDASLNKPSEREVARQKRMQREG